ncbi:MAG: efflux RND transporter periplasmic adaptor subunit [Gammaproteobacteria bacterium]|nr:efflux RND transporter periplasmic adaptor subunit [Gammaproteobacteria bacterium]
MKRQLIIPILLAVPLGAYLLYERAGSVNASQEETVIVAKGPLAVWSTYQGSLESRTAMMIASKFRGSATVIELAPEGAEISNGDVLVRFESSSLEQEVVGLERDHALAESELNSLKNAKIPLELRELDMDLIEVRSTLNSDRQYLDASIRLAKEGLVSEQEIEQQKDKVEEITTQLETLELRLQLTGEFLHPSELKRAQAKLASAAQALQLAKQQVLNSVVRAPTDGTVIYKPLHIGGEFRTVRVGDSIFQNQPFMVLTDMNDFLVHLEVPEGELALVQEGTDVFIQPLAYPGVRLRGMLETVGSMVQTMPGQPAWQMFFHVAIGLEDVDSRLRPGMTVTAHILSYYNPDTTLIPRVAVRWEAGRSFATVATGSLRETRQIELGMANEHNYDVIAGLIPGDEVFIE